ncbi:MAG: alpha/beta hydrolase [Rhodobacteraceae bacterium]|nr:alpha/beta hydrolase [Paracoccaceae bacterium]
MTPAPYFGGDSGDCSASWLHTSDDVKIRLVHWPEGHRGTILLFNGRTEYAEKFSDAATEFRHRGFAFATFDWRGQGLSDRQSGDPALCHIDDFSEFQLDADAALTALKRLGAAEPIYLVGHSMGGCIALRALHRGFDVEATLFAAPMWRIYLNRILRRVGFVVAELSVRFGQSRRYLVGTDQRNYIHMANPGKNLLTSDSEIFFRLKAQIESHPELATGGPSYGWLRAALRECRELMEIDPPAHRAHILIGDQDRVVDPKAVRIINSRWSQCSLETIADARHELMMERPPIRQYVFNQVATFFSQRS